LGVPQGSVLAPLLFATYLSPIQNLFQSFGVLHQQYADDTQIYISVTPQSLTSVSNNLQDCLSAVKDWFSHNGLVINPDKSETLLLSTPQRIKKLDSLGFANINVGGTAVSFSDNMRTLGITLDSTLTFNKHVENICRSGYCHLRAIRHIRKIIDEADANALARAFVQSRLDYCNSLLFNTSENNFSKLQRLQNSLARIVTQSPRCIPSLSLLQYLHWLPIKHRVNYKIASLTFKIWQSGRPQPLSELLHKYTCGRSQRSLYINTLVKPRTHLALCDKSFSVAAPQVWNALPLEMRLCTSHQNFHTNLKSTLFTAAFG